MAPSFLAGENDGDAECSECDSGECCPEYCSHFGVDPFVGDAVGAGAVPAALCEVDRGRGCDCNGEQRQNGEAVVGEPTKEDGADRDQRQHCPAPGKGGPFRLQTSISMYWGGRSLASHVLIARG
jgi:hypothetical protein